jgi:hypothetical protein
MDWIQIGLKVAQLGLPTLGSLLGGPLGGAIGGILAKAIGAADATPEAVDKTLGEMDPNVLIQKLRSTEAEAVAFVDAQAKVAIAQSKDISDLMKAELVDSQDHPSWFGIFQRGWRPAFAWLLLVECGGLGAIFGWEAVTADFKTLTALGEHESFMLWWFGMQFATIGVFGIGRSQEKVAAITAAGQATPQVDIGGIVGQVVDRVKNKFSREW